MCATRDAITQYDTNKRLGNPRGGRSKSTGPRESTADETWPRARGDGGDDVEEGVQVQGLPGGAGLRLPRALKTASRLYLLGGSWDLVSSYNWAHNSTAVSLSGLMWVRPIINYGVISPVLSSS